jgi:1,4-dihydroxy-2-naphthoate octaprenyltransferase
MIMNAKVWILAARPKTLWAAASPVVIGLALAYRDGVFHAASGSLALVAAVLIQIGTNYYNDYKDFDTGADTKSRKGPTRAVLAGLVSPLAMKRAAFVAFGLAVAAGTYLMIRGGWPIVLIGFASILFGFLYTGGKFSLARLGLADVFVFIFFGPVAVAGTYFVQALTWSGIAWLAGIAPGVLSVAILMVNNVRDIEEDRASGKRTVVVRFGRSFGVRAYVVCIFVAAIVPLVLHLTYDGPIAAVAAAIIIPVSLPAMRTIHRTSVELGEQLNPVLAATGRLLFIYSLCFSVAWITG